MSSEMLQFSPALVANSASSTNSRKIRTRSDGGETGEQDVFDNKDAEKAARASRHSCSSIDQVLAASEERNLLSNANTSFDENYAFIDSSELTDSCPITGGPLAHRNPLIVNREQVLVDSIPEEGEKTSSKSSVPQKFRAFRDSPIKLPKSEIKGEVKPRRWTRTLMSSPLISIRGTPSTQTSTNKQENSVEDADSVKKQAVISVSTTTVMRHISNPGGSTHSLTVTCRKSVTSAFAPVKIVDSPTSSSQGQSTPSSPVEPKSLPLNHLQFTKSLVKEQGSQSKLGSPSTTGQIQINVGSKPDLNSAANPISTRPVTIAHQHNPAIRRSYSPLNHSVSSPNVILGSAHKSLDHCLRM